MTKNIRNMVKKRRRRRRFRKFFRIFHTQTQVMEGQKQREIVPTPFSKQKLF